MIPLIRPIFPAWSEIEPFFKKSLNTGQLANFGVCFQEVVSELKRMTDRYCLPVANGTCAIQLAIQTVFPRGARIALPDYTHVGTLQAIVAAGCIPVLFPVTRDLWTISGELLELHKDEFDGFIVVSPFGYRVDFLYYDFLADQLKKPVIYDLAGAWGIKAKTKNPVTYSLHATKNFSCGEGGLVCFQDQEQWETARRFSNFETLPDRTVDNVYGNNLKVDELKCAVILAFLKNHHVILNRIEHKKMLVHYYQDLLKDVCIPHNLIHENSAPSLCVLAGFKAKKLEELGPSKGVIMKQYYPLLTEMAGLSRIARVGASGPFFSTCVALPSDEGIDEANKVVEVIRKLNKNK